MRRGGGEVSKVGNIKCLTEEVYKEGMSDDVWDMANISGEMCSSIQRGVGIKWRASLCMEVNSR